MVSGVNSSGGGGTASDSTVFTDSSFSHHTAANGEKMKRIIEVEEHVLDAYNIVRRVGKGVRIA